MKLSKIPKSETDKYPKMATVTEKKYLDEVADHGCIVCRNLGYGDTPAEIHHLRSGMGGGQRNSNFIIIPLCAEHHRNGGYGTAYHAGRSAFEANHGTEMQLLAQTIELVFKNRGD